MYPRTDETGKKYNYLTFVSFLKHGKQGTGAIWIVRCDCGELKEVHRTNVIKGKVKTCGKPACVILKRLRQEMNRNTPKQVGMKIYAQYVRLAAKRRKSWSLTPEAFCAFLPMPCTYCGSPADPHNEVDRVHRRLGYSQDNCVPSCQTCISVRARLPVQEFLNHIHKIYTHIFCATPSADSP